MSGQQSFQQRVLIPLVVIVGTVGVLAFLGSALMGLGSSSNTASENPAPVSTESVAALPSATDVATDAATPLASDSASPSASPSAIPSGITAVSVMNGTQTAGLAKSTADKLTASGWIIKEVGNWKGAGLAKSTIFYPADLETDATDFRRRPGKDEDPAGSVVGRGDQPQ